jgi:hypothetical protein
MSVDLLRECNHFVEEKYPVCDWRHLVLQHATIGNMGMPLGTQWSESEQEEITEKCTTAIDQQRPQDCPFHPMIILSAIADLYEKVGTYRLAEKGLTEDEVRNRVGYLKTSNTIREKIGDADDLAQVQNAIEYFQFYCVNRTVAQEAFGEDETEEERLERYRAAYQMYLDQCGEVRSLNQIANYAGVLNQSQRTNAVWRLLKKLIAISKQNHGQDHVNTKELEAQMKRYKTIFVEVKGHKGLYEALRCENDEYVVQGPLQQPKSEDEEETIKVCDCMRWNLGCADESGVCSNGGRYIFGR